MIILFSSIVVVAVIMVLYVLGLYIYTEGQIKGLQTAMKIHDEVWNKK